MMFDPWVLELDSGFWKAEGSGMTVIYANARRYKTIGNATHALAAMRYGREYRNAKIYRESEHKEADHGTE